MAGLESGEIAVVCLHLLPFPRFKSAFSLGWIKNNYETDFAVYMRKLTQ
jgi:hypothetical protein